MQVWAVEGIPEVVAGDDIAALILERVQLDDGDIVVISSKIISKAEGRTVEATDREAAITSQTVRVVATRGSTRIVENPLCCCPKTPMPLPGRFRGGWVNASA
jgi:coenzyme F420-0:L-glutamate ligase / coenzyme F420-1:gamma-L-glutamate ligase